jgi:hypothetical protein
MADWWLLVSLSHWSLLYSLVAAHIRKHRFQWFFYCWMCIHCQRKVFTALLPRNGHLLWLNYSSFQASYHYWNIITVQKLFKNSPLICVTPFVTLFSRDMKCLSSPQINFTFEEHFLPHCEQLWRVWSSEFVMPCSLVQVQWHFCGMLMDLYWTIQHYYPDQSALWKP